MRKYVSSLLILSIIASMGSISFAAESVDGKQIRAEAIADVVERVTGTSEINTNLGLTESAYEAEGEDVNISIPVDGEKPVITAMPDNERIAMNLPKEVSGKEGIVTRDGTVVYNSSEAYMAISVQALQEEKDGIAFDSVRTLITIENMRAPREYSFIFDLPENYSLVKDYDYADDYDEYDCGQVFVVNDKNETICTIDPAWAKDANGVDLESYYKIDGNTLTQVVCFNEKTVFPVVADPTSHPNKTSNYYYSKAGIKKLRDKYTELDYATFYNGIITCASYYVQPFAGVCSTFVFLNQLYSGFKYASWNSVYINFKKNYAKVSVIFRWRNGGKNSGYVKDSQKVTYVDGISA